MIDHTIALIIVLNDAAETSDWVFFDTHIDGCEFDSVNFTGAVKSVPYYIYNPSQ